MLHIKWIYSKKVFCPAALHKYTVDHRVNDNFRGGSKSGLFFGTALQYKSSSPIKMWCIIYCVLHKLKVIKNNFQCQKTVLELHFSISFDSDLEFWQNIDWIIFRWKSDLYLTAIFNVNIKIFMSLLLWIWDRHPKLF